MPMLMFLIPTIISYTVVGYCSIKTFKTIAQNCTSEKTKQLQIQLTVAMCFQVKF